MIIPDYLIIDEIRRRKEQAWQPETVQLPLPNYEIPDEDMDYPRRQSNPTPEKPKNNGVIIIDLNGGGRTF